MTLYWFSFSWELILKGYVWSINGDFRGSSLWTETQIVSYSGVNLVAAGDTTTPSSPHHPECENEGRRGRWSSWLWRWTGCRGCERAGAITESLLALWEKVLRPWRPTAPSSSRASACRTVPGVRGRVWLQCVGGRCASRQTAAGVSGFASVCLLAETSGGVMTGRQAAGSCPVRGGAGAGTDGGGRGTGRGESLWHLNLKKLGWGSLLLEGSECTSFSS